MAAYSWDESMSVGIPVLDEEHRSWIETFNLLEAAVNGEGGRAVIESTIDMLLEHSKLHFRHEEKFLIENGYPDVEEQVRQHEYFAMWISEAKKDLGDPEDEELAADVLEMMESWLVTHIREVDRKYAVFFGTLPSETSDTSAAGPAATPPAES